MRLAQFLFHTRCGVGLRAAGSGWLDIEIRWPDPHKFSSWVAISDISDIAATCLVLSYHFSESVNFRFDPLVVYLKRDSSLALGFHSSLSKLTWLPWDANDSIEQITRDKVTKWTIQKTNIEICGINKKQVSNSVSIVLMQTFWRLQKRKLVNSQVLGPRSPVISVMNGSAGIAGFFWAMGVPGFYRWAVRRVPYLRAKSCGLPYEFDNLYLGNWAPGAPKELRKDMWLEPKNKRGNSSSETCFVFGWIRGTWTSMELCTVASMTGVFKNKRSSSFAWSRFVYDGDMLTCKLRKHGLCKFLKLPASWYIGWIKLWGSTGSLIVHRQSQGSWNLERTRELVDESRGGLFGMLAT